METREELIDQSMVWQRVKGQRVTCGFSQANVLAWLRTSGIPTSKSHYSNMESGRHPFTEDHLAALDALLQFGHRNESDAPEPQLNGWLDFATRLVEDAPDAPVDLIRSHHHLDEAQRLRPADVTGAVRSCLGGLTDSLLKRDSSSTAQIFILGFPGPLSSADDGGAYRSSFYTSLVAAMKAGARCTHLIPSVAGDERAELIRLAGPLLACTQYEAFVLTDEPVGFDAIVVEPSFDYAGGSIQFLNTRGSGGEGVSLLSLDAPVVEAHVKYAELLCEAPKTSLVTSASPAIGLPDIEPTVGELDFYRALTSRFGRGAFANFSLGFFPNALVPESAWAARVDERKRHSSAGTVWEPMLEQHKHRRKALLEMLSDGVPVKVLLPHGCLEAFVSLGSQHFLNMDDGGEIPSWRIFSPEERRNSINSIAGLDAEFPNFEIRALGESSSTAARRSQMEIRGGSSGFLYLQTPARDGAKYERESVNLLIETPVAVAGFNSLFLKKWKSAEPIAAKDLRRIIKTKMSL